MHWEHKKALYVSSILHPFFEGETREMHCERHLATIHSPRLFHYGGIRECRPGQLVVFGFWWIVGINPRCKMSLPSRLVVCLVYLAGVLVHVLWLRLEVARKCCRLRQRYYGVESTERFWRFKDVLYISTEHPVIFCQKGVRPWRYEILDLAFISHLSLWRTPMTSSFCSEASDFLAVLAWACFHTGIWGEAEKFGSSVMKLRSICWRPAILKRAHSVVWKAQTKIFFTLLRLV